MTKTYKIEWTEKHVLYTEDKFYAEMRKDDFKADDKKIDVKMSTLTEAE